MFGGPTVRILSFSGGALTGVADTLPPVRSEGLPAGVLTSGTRETTLSLKTRSVWWGAALHISIAFTMDVCALTHAGRIFG